MATHALVLRGSAWSALDGSLAAPVATAQHPTLLDGYTKVPPWSVAGVDYAVGYSDSVSLTDWQSISGTGITVDTGTHVVRVDGTSGVNFDSIDFSLHNGATLLLVGSTNCTITRCKFGGTNYTSIGNAVIYADGTSGGLTVEYCIIDGGGAGTGSTLIASAGAGAHVIRYNWFKNYPQHPLEMTQASKTATLDYRYNLIEGGGKQTGSHLNFVQFDPATVTTPSVLCNFNTTYQQLEAAGGEGFQFYSTGVSHDIAGVSCCYNVMIATTGGGGAQQMSYMIHGGGAENDGVCHDNYMDLTTAYGPFYAGSFTGWTLSNNWNMVTGAALTNTP